MEFKDELIEQVYEFRIRRYYAMDQFGGNPFLNREDLEEFQWLIWEEDIPYLVYPIRVWNCRRWRMRCSEYNYLFFKQRRLTYNL